MTDQGKHLTKHEVLDLWFFKSLPWPVIEIHGSKIYFYLNIFLSQYLLCVKMSRVKRP